MAITTSGTTLTFNDSTTQTTAPVNTNANVNSVSAGSGISVNSTTGAVTVTNSGVTSVSAGTGISVSSSTGGVTITNSAPAVTAGEAKAWVNFNGVSGTSIRASYNISSVTRNSTGYYTVAMTNAMIDANYAVIASIGSGNPTPSVLINSSSYNTPVTPTSSTFGVCAINPNSGNGSDIQYFSISVLR